MSAVTRKPDIPMKKLITAFSFDFTLFNGVLMTIAGIYLVNKGKRVLGWMTLFVVLLFYLTALLIPLQARPTA